MALASSKRDEDWDACLGAKAYLIKGGTGDDAIAIAKEITSFLPKALDHDRR